MFIFIGGDFNAHVAKPMEWEEAVFGLFGLADAGGRTDNVQRLINFCQETGLAVSNTFFEHADPQAQATWLSPRAGKEQEAKHAGNRRRTLGRAWATHGVQIDHFLVSSVLMQAGIITDARVHANINHAPNITSDHRPQVLHLRVREAP